MLRNNDHLRWVTYLSNDQVMTQFRALGREYNKGISDPRLARGWARRLLNVLDVVKERELLPGRTIALATATVLNMLEGKKQLETPWEK